MRSLSDLVDDRDPGWRLVRQWIDAAANTVEILPVERPRADAVLHALQVTTHSPLGAIAFETGGLLIDGGWVRVLGGGCPRMVGDLAWWNGLGERSRPEPLPGLLVVAYDVLGGVFALDGGALGVGGGAMFYFAPDSLRWEDMKRGYGDFLVFLFQGNMNQYYGDYRWSGWESEVAAMSADQGLSLIPPLWTKEGKDISRVSRRPVPMEELFRVELSFLAQIEGRA